MATFKKKTKTKQDIPTSALPDIIFMLLFFFMIATTFRESELLVKNSLPQASELTKLEKKSLVSYIYIGEPTDKKNGTEARIQVNDVLISTDQIVQHVISEKDKLGEDGNKITMSLKIDKEAKMGIISDVRQELREANALKVNYAANKKLRLD
ncbi:biopolymer transporter ExbD [Flammeovirga yaeyamensis]|uniref:Biopolymer transporter ExbD n=1 Tax=Flammeovirga yaeyamensis TaxID=367791 RepID=A0AAX1N6B8_9BACT|nr:MULTISPECIES: biopolymer transporter ExbD [Flammeovirga]ANQ49421.1 biopolymer transporter ExbD [Flammeovirga sp. MY04]MBB3697692.1 biopolymer transport protein ExbD [Flammeovirga yaeyamensis]NMF35948.1 biopolymer transporter ExbD [Flammeovirga yaeyamensis]QWG03104.1 biopolymer transporter ExbD [Flammeovirga yaeyamensis]